MRIGSLFSGAGGLDLAVQEVFGGEVVWHAEIDKAASKVLAHRFPGVPNLGDISAVDWAELPAVDVLCGGFPCQDVSAAGKRAGIKAGTRSGLWSVFADAIDELRPQWVVIENVRGLLSATAHRTVDDADSEVEPAAGVMGDGAGRPVLRAAGAVLGDLADLGYDAQWATVSAASVGAPHRRERVFIVATDTNVAAGWQRGQFGQAPEASGRREGQAWPDIRRDTRSGDSDASDAPRNGRQVSSNFDRFVQTGELPSAENMRADIARWTSSAVVGVNPVDVERHSPAGRSVGDGDVALLPTPRSSDCFGAGQHGDGGMDLRTTMALLCTPSASDGAGGKTSRSGGRIDEPLLGGQAREMASAWGKYEPAIRRWEQIAGSAPAPTEPNKNGNPRLSAAFSEWLMGWPQGWVTHPDIGISRNDQLRIIGNGVCPQQAIAALQSLLSVSEVTA